MKIKILRMRPVLFLLGASVVLNAAGKPPIQTAPPATAQPIYLPSSTSSTPGPIALPQVALLTKTTGTNVFTMPIEPHWTLGTNTLVTGAVVDCLDPQQTWKMLNPPPESEKKLPWQSTASLPVTGPQFFNSDLAVHEADFALVRFSLGSPPKLPKVQP
jgi:hypothetical protein